MTKTKYRELKSPAIVMGKFSKMFDEDSIAQIRGSCDDCDGGVCVGGWVTKIAFEKIKPTFSIFLAAVRFFRLRFSSPNFPLSQSQDPRIRDIVSSSNIFENLKFSKVFDEDAMSRIWGYCDCDGEGVGDENCGRSVVDRPTNTKHKEVSLFFVCEVLQTMKLAGFSLMFTDFQPNRMTKPIDLIRRDKAVRLFVHMWVFKLLNQATWPSSSTDLAGRLAVWMCL